MASSTAEKTRVNTIQRTSFINYVVWHITLHVTVRRLIHYTWHNVKLFGTLHFMLHNVIWYITLDIMLRCLVHYTLCNVSLFGTLHFMYWDSLLGQSVSQSCSCTGKNLTGAMQTPRDMHEYFHVNVPIVTLILFTETLLQKFLRFSKVPILRPIKHSRVFLQHKALSQVATQ